MKTLLVLLLVGISFAAFAVESRAQSKFDIVGYTAPAGWAVDKDANSIRFTKESGSNYCVISLTKSVDGVGDSAKNFELLWKGMATDGLNAGTPQRGKGEKNGWQAEVGVGAFENDGLKGAAMLTTFTGNGKVVAVLAITNSDSFQPDIETFVDNVKLPPVASGSQPVAGPNAGAANAGRSSLVGLWVRYKVETSGYMNGMPRPTAGYFRREYAFNADGTYRFRAKDWSVMAKDILYVSETGTWSVNGNTLTIKPNQGTGGWWSKAASNRTNEWGRRVRTSAYKLETVSYTFDLRHFSGSNETHLILRSSGPTERDGNDPQHEFSYSPRAAGSSLIDDPPR